MPFCKIAPGGKQEALSLPFQQTALYVKLYGEELSEEEYEAINAVLPIEKLGDLYQENRADSVKFQYKQEAINAELVNYFKIWFKQFFKQPQVYFRAFFSLTDGYYYLYYDNWKLDLYSCKQAVDILGDVAGLSIPQWVIDLEEKTSGLLNDLINMPVVGNVFRVATATWFMVITFFWCVYINKKEWLLILIPVFLNFAVCLLSPWNGVYRYALPIIYAIPVFVCMLGYKKH